MKPLYRCDNSNCGWEADRDYSASLNLLGLAETDLETCGEVRADFL
ncbi:MAG: hypothetical protein ACFB02_06120 [Mastigocoleus sp.]